MEVLVSSTEEVHGDITAHKIGDLVSVSVFLVTILTVLKFSFKTGIHY